MEEEFIKELIFERNQKIVQRDGEDYRDLHERLREIVTNNIYSVRENTRIITPSWYSIDVSKIVNIENAVAICTSTCKHELPYQIFVGRRKEGWQRKHPTMPDKYIYTLYDLGRDLTLDEKNTIYDKM